MTKLERKSCRCAYHHSAGVRFGRAKGDSVEREARDADLVVFLALPFLWDGFEAKLTIMIVGLIST